MPPPAADEPSSVLDWVEQHNIWEALLRSGVWKMLELAGWSQG